MKMYKVAILGCENSHAKNFLKAVLEEKIVDDVAFVGVYSDDPEASAALEREFGVPAVESYDAFVGKVDGIIITARHGDNHYKFAKPYMDCGIPMFIDKPITCAEADARAFMQELKQHHVPVSGGSVCILDDYVQELRRAVENQTYGKVHGGYLRAPIMMHSPYGGFFFYAQHLAQVMMEIFGYYPVSVRAFPKGEDVNCTVHYEDYDVSLSYVPNSGVYYASISCEDDVVGGRYYFKDGFQREFCEFHDLLKGKPQKMSYEDFFAPVYVLNAIARSLESGKEEMINRM